MNQGTKIGHYEIREKIGEGGMGEVYRAHDSRLDREVAIKVLPADLSKDEDRLRRFEQEAKVESNTLDAFMRLLRSKVDLDATQRLIHTVRGVGYVLRSVEPC